MATQDDARRIASKLPGAVESSERFAFEVMHKGKSRGFIWSWAERVDPKKARIINDSVLVILVQDLTIKEILLGSDPEGKKLFTEPHYASIAAVLVRLEAIEVEELEDLIIEAWRTKAPPDVVKEFDRQHRE